MFITSFGEQNITYKCCSNFLIHLSDTQTARTSSKPVFNTDKEAEAAAKAMGYVKVNERSQNAAVFKKGNSYITRDRTGHGHGGAWKEANSVKALSSKETRNATLDINMKKVKD